MANVDVGTSVISEFYTPLVPKGYDFLEEIKKVIQQQTVHAGDVRSGSRRCGLILLAGVAIATPALNPPYLTGGGTNRQETVKKTLENPLVTRDLQNFSVCQMGFKS